MSNNLELAKSVYEAFAAGDIPAVLAVLDPEVALKLLPVAL